MSNYNNLKSSINNNIYENQTQQITGTVLNAILNEMTNALGAGYQFAGVATVGMTPSEPDARIFYLAGEGIYTSFDGIQVPAGKLGILKWDNRWHLETIDGLGSGGANLTGYVTVASTDDLPDEGVATLGYLCGENLYLYVGEGGDTKEGKYQNCGSFRGPQGDSVQDVEQTQTSLENGGINKIKFTLSNGISCEFQVRNGTTSSGLFPTLADLQAAYPSPVVGQYAFVGSGFPADIYVCTTAGTWSDSGEDYDGDNVDLTDYATKAEVNELELEVNVLNSKLPSIEQSDEVCVYIRESKDLNSSPNVFRVLVTDLEVYATGKYIKTDGTLATLSGCNVYKFTVPYGVKLLNAVRGSTLGTYGCYELEDGTFVALSVKSTLQNQKYPSVLATQPIKYIYANYKSGDGSGVEYLEYIYRPIYDIPLNGSSVLCGMGNVVAVNKCINASTGAFDDYTGVSLVKIPIQKGKIYNLSGQYTSGIYDGNGNYLGTVTNPMRKTPIGAMYLIVGYKGNTTVVYEEDSNTKSEYSTSVKKPLSFSGKSAVFFGDSICAGYASDESQDVVNNWVKMFSDAVGLTYNNQGVDSTLIAKVTGKGCITERILATSITEDFVFVAGGTNDAYWNVPLGSISDSTTATFFGALNVIADYLDTNYPTKEVIFVMPTGRTSGFSASSLLTSLDEYRRAIYTVCAIRNYSVVNGGDFGFPGDATISSDGLHPTKIGYKLYAKCMLNALL